MKVKLWKQWSLYPISNSNEFCITEEFSCFIVNNNIVREIVVTEWFITNMGSIPRVFRFLLNPVQFNAYLFHDFLYYKSNNIYSRKEADIILLEYLQVEWASKIKRYLIYAWVRLMGWFFYKK